MIKDNSPSYKTFFLSFALTPNTAGDGICCEFGQGWATITNGTKSQDSSSGTIMWVLPGDDFTSKAEVYIWVNSDGFAGIVDYDRGYVPETSSLWTASTQVHDSSVPEDPVGPADASPGTTPLTGSTSAFSENVQDTADSEEGNTGEVLDIPIHRTSPLDP